MVSSKRVALLHLTILILIVSHTVEALYGGGSWPCLNCDTSAVVVVEGETPCEVATCLTEGEAAFPIREHLNDKSPLWDDLVILTNGEDNIFLDPKLDTDAKRSVTKNLKNKLLKVAADITDRCSGVSIMVKEAFVQASPTEKRLDLKYEARSAQIMFTKLPTDCVLPIVSTRLDLCYGLGDTPVPAHQVVDSQCPFPWCIDPSDQKCVNPNGADECTRACTNTNTECLSPDIQAEETCSRLLQKFGTTAAYGIRDHDEGVLAAGEYGFCKAKLKGSSNPKQYKGLTGEGKTESELGMLADIAIQQGFDFVKRQGNYVQVAVTPDICQVQLDAVFVLDGSISINAQDWEATKDVVKSFIDRFDVIPAVNGAEPTQVGAIGYSASVFEDSMFHLNKYGQNAEAIKCAIGAIDRYPRETSTGGALQYVQEQMFTVANGMREDAKRIPRVVILITDGEPTDDTTAKYARKLKEETEAELYVIFIGKSCNGFAVGSSQRNICDQQRTRSESLFKNLVSEPKDKHFFGLQGITFVPSVVGEISQSLCTKAIDLAPCCSEAEMDYVRVESGYYQYFSTPCADTSSTFTVTVEAEQPSMQFELYVLIETDPEQRDLPGPITHDAQSVDLTQQSKSLTFTAPKSKTLRIAVRGMGEVGTKVKLSFKLDFSDALQYNTIQDRELGPFYELGGTGKDGTLVADVELLSREMTQFDQEITMDDKNAIVKQMRFESVATDEFLRAEPYYEQSVRIHATDTLTSRTDDSGSLSATLVGKGVDGNECVVLSKPIDVRFLLPGATRPKTTARITQPTTATPRPPINTNDTTVASDTTEAEAGTKVVGNDGTVAKDDGYAYDFYDDDVTTTTTTPNIFDLALASGTVECVEQIVATGRGDALVGSTILIESGNWADWECAVASVPGVNGAADAVFWNCNCSEFNPLWLLLLLLLCCCCIPLFLLCKRKRKEEEEPVEPSKMDNPMFDADPPPIGSETYGDEQYEGARDRGGSYLEPTQRSSGASRGAPMPLPPTVVPFVKRPVLGASKRPKAAATPKAAPPPAQSVIYATDAEAGGFDGGYLEPVQNSVAKKASLSPIKGRVSAPKPARAGMAQKKPPMRPASTSFSNFIIPDETGAEKIYDNTGSMLGLASPVMKVTVVTPNGERISIETDPDETLYDVAAGVSEQTGVAPDNIRFKHKGKPLPVGTLDTLDDLGLKSGDVLHMLPSTFSVTVITPEGVRHNLVTQPNQTLSDIQSGVTDACGMPAALQQFAFEGNPLASDSTDTFADIGITDGAELHLLPADFSITVVTPEGERFNLDTSPTQRLADVQRGVTDACGMPASAQMFQFEGCPLSNDSGDTFSDLGVTNGSVLHLMPMQIFIKDCTASGPDSRVFTIDVKPTDTIEQIKEKASQESGLPLDSIDLQYKGDDLVDPNATLADHKIRHNDTVDMVASEYIEIGTPLLATPMKFSKSHMIGVRLIDRVVHHPLIPSDDGKGITLITDDGNEPTFEWLPDLITHYACNRFKCPFTLQNEVVGYPSLGSTSRFNWLITRSDVLGQDATDDVIDAQDTMDAFFDAMFNELLHEVIDHVGTQEDGGIYGDLTLDRPAWVAAADEPAWNDAALDVAEYLANRSASVADLGLDAAVDRVIQALAQSIPEHVFEEIIDRVPINSRGRVDPREVDFNDTQTWDHSYQDVHPWYIPDMARSEVTEYLREVGLGEFIVYERLDSQESPTWEQAPPIREFERVAKAQDGNDSSSDDEPAQRARKKGEPGEPRTVPGKKKQKKKPKAFRFNTQVRVMRRGQELVAFKDDDLLELEIDAHTRMVKGKKDGASPGKSYGRKMFKGLESLGDETQDVHGGLMNEIESHLEEMFKGADADGDGMLSLAEAKAQGMSEATFREIDGDGNGQLTEEEFRVWFTERRGAEVDGFIAPYTHGVMSRDEATATLEDAADANPEESEGLYLIRCSEKVKSGFTLSMMNGGSVKHLLFKRQSEGYICNKIVFPAPNLEALIKMLVGGHPDMAKLGSYVTRKKEVGNVLDATDGSNIRRKASVYLGFKESPGDEDI